MDISRPLILSANMFKAETARVFLIISKNKNFKFMYIAVCKRRGGGGTPLTDKRKLTPKMSMKLHKIIVKHQILA